MYDEQRDECAMNVRILREMFLAHLTDSYYNEAAITKKLETTEALDFGDYAALDIQWMSV